MTLTLSNLIAEQVISALYAACDLHTVVPGPLELTCWRQFVAQWGDWKKSQIAPSMLLLLLFQLRQAEKRKAAFTSFFIKPKAVTSTKVRIFPDLSSSLTKQSGLFLLLFVCCVCCCFFFVFCFFYSAIEVFLICVLYCVAIHCCWCHNVESYLHCVCKCLLVI